MLKFLKSWWHFAHIWLPFSGYLRSPHYITTYGSFCIFRVSVAFIYSHKPRGFTGVVRLGQAAQGRGSGPEIRSALSFQCFRF